MTPPAQVQGLHSAGRPQRARTGGAITLWITL
jgi:hypothetical protein